MIEQNPQKYSESLTILNDFIGDISYSISCEDSAITVSSNDVIRLEKVKTYLKELNAVYGKIIYVEKPHLVDNTTTTQINRITNEEHSDGLERVLAMYNELHTQMSEIDANAHDTSLRYNELAIQKKSIEKTLTMLGYDL